MLKKLLYKSFFSIFILLPACGGGGSSNSVSQQPVASTSAFDLRAAYISSVANSSSYRFSISGAFNSVPITSGSGTATTGSLAFDNFEGAQAQKRTTTVTGSFIIDGNTYPLNSSGTSWFDTNYSPLGLQSNEEYVVIDGASINWPNAARVGDTGQVYTAKRYQNSAKATQLGTLTATYVVEPDTANTVLVTSIYTYKDMAGNPTQILSSQSRITTANKETRIKETVIDYLTNRNWTLTFQS